MAITATHITINSSVSVQSSYTSASISPTANKLGIFVVGNGFSTGPNTPTLSGAGMTWVQIATKVDAANIRRITFFRALSPNPGSGAVTIDFAGQNQINCAWCYAEFSGTDLSGTNGSGAIVQSNSGETSGTNTSVSVTLSTFSSKSNATYGAVRRNVTTSVTPGSNFTELGETNTTGLALEHEFSSANQTTVDWSWASEASVNVALAVEIKAATGGMFLQNFI